MLLFIIQFRKKLTSTTINNSLSEKIRKSNSFISYLHYYFSYLFDR
jgi:hypothetical protein